MKKSLHAGETDNEKKARKQRIKALLTPLNVYKWIITKNPKFELPFYTEAPSVIASAFVREHVDLCDDHVPIIMDIIVSVQRVLLKTRGTLIERAKQALLMPAHMADRR